MRQERLRLVAGLGNPGNAYDATRHNAGFMVADTLARTYSIRLRQRKFDAVVGRGRIEDMPVLVVKPMAFMNLSGPPLKRLSDYFNVPPADMVVIHDDIDLELGRLKIKRKGGDGGHKGLRSIIEAFGGGDFTRLRIGIGCGGPHGSVTDFVLGMFGAEEQNVLAQTLERAQDAVVTILVKGAKEGMNRFNNRTSNTIS